MLLPVVGDQIAKADNMMLKATRRSGTEKRLTIVCFHGSVGANITAKPTAIACKFTVNAAITINWTMVEITVLLVVGSGRWVRSPVAWNLFLPDTTKARV